MSHAATPELLVSGNGINVAPEGDFNDSKEQRWGGGGGALSGFHILSEIPVIVQRIGGDTWRSLIDIMSR